MTINSRRVPCQQICRKVHFRIISMDFYSCIIKRYDFRRFPVAFVFEFALKDILSGMNKRLPENGFLSMAENEFEGPTECTTTNIYVSKDMTDRILHQAFTERVRKWFVLSKRRKTYSKVFELFSCAANAPSFPLRHFTKLHRTFLSPRDGIDIHLQSKFHKKGLLLGFVILFNKADVQNAVFVVFVAMSIERENRCEEKDVPNVLRPCTVRKPNYVTQPWSIRFDNDYPRIPQYGRHADRSGWSFSSAYVRHVACNDVLGNASDQNLQQKNLSRQFIRNGKQSFQQGHTID